MPQNRGGVRSPNFLAALLLAVCVRGSGGAPAGLSEIGRVAPGFKGIVFAQLAAGRQGRDFQGGRIILLTPDGNRRILSEGFESAADPEVSFDGARILFAGRTTASDSWDIYEVEAAGSPPRRLTRGLGDCRHPVYQSSIFELDSPKPWQQITFVNGDALYSIRPDGSGLRRLTYNPAGSGEATMIPDGRLVFANRYNTRVALFGVNVDGTDYAAFSTQEGRAAKRMPCVTASGLAVFVESAAARSDGAGTLATVSLRRPLHSYRPIPTEPGTLYAWPSPLPDGRVLVSAARGQGPFAIHLLAPETGKSELLFGEPGHDVLQARLVHPRQEPDGRSTVVDEKVPTGKFYCLSVGTTDFTDAAWLKAAAAHRIRVLERYEQGTRLIGETDLDADGSFHLQVPANIPVQFQTVDARGMALRSSAWVWVKNRENRGCIGCHEDGERTPENGFAKALDHPAAQFTLPEQRRRTVEYRKAVAPILAARCASCHDGKAQQKLDLAKQVTAGAARTSPLVWRIYGSQTAKPWDRVPASTARPGKMPPAGSKALTDEEKRTIVEWIDFGANGLNTEVKR